MKKTYYSPEADPIVIALEEGLLITTNDGNTNERPIEDPDFPIIDD